MTPLALGADGSMNSAQAESVIRSLLFDLRGCDDRRQLLVDAWPRVDVDPTE